MTAVRPGDSKPSPGRQRPGISCGGTFCPAVCDVIKLLLIIFFSHIAGGLVLQWVTVLWGSVTSIMVEKRLRIMDAGKLRIQGQNNGS